MKRPNPSELMKIIRSIIASLRQQRFFNDKLSLALLIPTVALNLLTLFIILAKVRPLDFAVPVRYSSLGGFDQLGPWYSVYRIGLFGLLVTVVNTTLAIISFGRSRITSFFLGAGAFVVALFCLIIGSTFAAIV